MDVPSDARASFVRPRHQMIAPIRFPPQAKPEFWTDTTGVQRIRGAGMWEVASPAELLAKEKADVRASRDAVVDARARETKSTLMRMIAQAKLNAIREGKREALLVVRGKGLLKQAKALAEGAGYKAYVAATYGNQRGDKDGPIFEHLMMSW